eukprot:6590981-Prymnesium_polylepis.1
MVVAPRRIPGGGHQRHRGGTAYDAPPVSVEGQRLRARLCIPPAGHLDLLGGGTAPRDAHRRKLVVAHF